MKELASMSSSSEPRIPSHSQAHHAQRLAVPPSDASAPTNAEDFAGEVHPSVDAHPHPDLSSRRSAGPYFLARTPTSPVLDLPASNFRTTEASKHAPVAGTESSSNTGAANHTAQPHSLETGIQSTSSQGSAKQLSSGRLVNRQEERASGGSADTEVSGRTSDDAEPSVVFFEGNGLDEHGNITMLQSNKDEHNSMKLKECTECTKTGTARKSPGEYDEEFDYVFEGGKREGGVHKQVFQPKPLPAHLVTQVKQQPLDLVEEEAEEEPDASQETGTSKPWRQPSWSTFVTSHSDFNSMTGQDVGTIVSEPILGDLINNFASPKAPQHGAADGTAAASSLQPAGPAGPALSGQGQLQHQGSSGLSGAGNGSATSGAPSTASGSVANEGLPSLHLLKVLSGESRGKPPPQRASIPPDAGGGRWPRSLEYGPTYQPGPAMQPAYSSWSAPIAANKDGQQPLQQQPQLPLHQQQQAATAAWAAAPAGMQGWAGGAAGVPSPPSLRGATHDLPSVRLLKALSGDSKQMVLELGRPESPGRLSSSSRSSSRSAKPNARGATADEQLLEAASASMAPPPSSMQHHPALQQQQQQQPQQLSMSAIQQSLNTDDIFLDHVLDSSKGADARSTDTPDTESRNNVIATIGSTITIGTLLGTSNSELQTMAATLGSTQSIANSLVMYASAGTGNMAGSAAATRNSFSLSLANQSSTVSRLATKDMLGHSLSGGKGQGGIDEWDAANQQRQREMQAEASSSRVFESVSYHEALVHLMSLDVDPVRGQVVSELPAAPGLFQRLFCLRPPALTPPLKEQQIRLLSLAKMPFNDQDPMCFKLLCSLYASFTGKPANQPRFGAHWADVGFQGDDPSTDLRGCGIYGLLQLYYLHQHDSSNAQKIYQLSRSKVQEFPLAVVSLNITKWTLQAVREGHLSQGALQLGSMIEIAGRFYVGTIYTFYKIWQQGKTMSESGFVLKNVEQACRRYPQSMVDASLLSLS